MDRKKLLKMTNRASRAIKPSVQSIMECVLLHIKDGVVKMRAVNHAMQVTVWEGIEDQDTSILATVNAANLKEVLNRLPSDEVTLSKVGDKLSIRSGKISLSIPCQNDPFPKEMDMKEPKVRALISRGDVEACSHAAMAKTMVNDKMSSYCLEIVNEDNHSYRITTVDGHRLASRGTKVPKVGCTEIVAPGELMAETVKISEGDTFWISFDGETIKVEGTGYSLIGKAQFNRFFNLDQIRDPGFDTYFEADRAQLLEALKVVTYFDKLAVLNIGKDKLMIRSRDAAKGDSEAELEIISNGPEIELGIDGNFFVAALESVSEEKIKIHYASKKAAIYFKGETFEEVMMPVRY